MTRLRIAVALAAVSLCAPAAARADVVLDWNQIAVTTVTTQAVAITGIPPVNPFAQARFMAITQLAVFEAVNAIAGGYEPYLGTIVAPVGASAEAAAVAAAHAVLINYFSTPANAATLNAARASSLAAIPDGTAKDNGIAVGLAAAAAMISARVGDGSAPPEFHFPTSTTAGIWQPTLGPPPTPASCAASGGILLHWQKVTPFGVAVDPTDPPGTWVAQFRPGPPPALTSSAYVKDYNEVKTVGSAGSTLAERPTDRANVVQFYGASSPSFVFGMAARQVSAAQGRSLSHNARTLALMSMASNDSLVASFATKYYYNYWRPETAIRLNTVENDGNQKTEPDSAFAPFITTPCFPGYPSNHASGSNSAAEILRRVYGAGGHALELKSSNPALAAIVLNYTTFKQITDDIDDARVYGGIHFRFDQEAGAVMGREIATYIYRHNLRKLDDGEE